MFSTNDKMRARCFAVAERNVKKFNAQQKKWLKFNFSSYICNFRFFFGMQRQKRMKKNEA
jgi:hypothetical protein